MAAYWLWTFTPRITAENDLLETAQYLFLLLACATHIFQSGKAPPKSVERHLRWNLALFCFALLLREFDIDRVGDAQIWHSIESLIRSLTLITLVIYWGWAWGWPAKKGRIHWCNISGIFATPTIVLTIIGCIFYAAGWPFDKLKFSIAADFSGLIEETLELNACMLLFFAACMRGYHSGTTETTKNKQKYLAEI